MRAAAPAVDTEMLQIAAIGFKAHAALLRSAGATHPLAQLTSSCYLVADDELLWCGHAGANLHPRAILVSSRVPHLDQLPIFRVKDRVPWRPPTARCNNAAANRTTLAMRGAELRSSVDAIGSPAGFGLMLKGEVPPFPLIQRIDAVEALVRACAADDADAAFHSAMQLIGLGPGLTPAGDDFIGGMLFGQRLFSSSRSPHWERTRTALVRAAQSRSNAISAALLADLADGQSFAPLHELSIGLVEGANREALLAAARRLTAIGHCSGWDMLAGLIAAITGSLRP